MRKLSLLLLAFASCGRPKPAPPVYQDYEQPVVQSAPAPLIQQQPMVYPMQQPTIIRERSSGMDWLPYMMLMNSGGSTHRTAERHFHHSEPAPPPAVVPQQPVPQRSMWNSFHEARQASKPGRYSSGGSSVSGPNRNTPATRSRSGYNRPSRSPSSSGSGRSYNRPSRSR